MGKHNITDYVSSSDRLFPMTEGYKTSKEAFVSGMTGSSITHVNLVSLVALVRPPNVSRLHVIA